MENPVDHTFDLGFVNFIQHPENKNYIVFRYKDKLRADSFEKYIQEAKIWFEKGEEENKSKHYYMYAIHKQDFTAAQKINFKVEGEHKKPIIKNAFLRYFLLVFSGIILTLALVGFCKQQSYLNSVSEKALSVDDKK
jgi:hypothetical protein